MNNPKGICVIFAPNTDNISTTTWDGTIRLFEPLADEIFVISANFFKTTGYSDNVHLTDVGMKGVMNKRTSPVIRAIGFMILQLKISYALFKISSKFDILVLGAGSSTIFLPSLTAKVLGKKVVSLRSGTDVVHVVAKVVYGKSVFGKYIFVPMIGMMERLNYQLADRIVIFCSHFTHQVLNKHRGKLSLGCSRFYVDTNRFKITKDTDSREYSIGFIGGFVDTGGVINFIKSLPLVLKEFPLIKVLIGGGGDLQDEVEREIKKANLGDSIILMGWIPHDDIPQYLNKTKVIVLPSYQEEGTHMLFEATACGAIFLSTPVGVIPDVIRDEVTGFIMEDNSPECVARNIIRVLNHPNLDVIAKNARELIEREYTYEVAIERYRNVLDSLGV